MFAPAVERMHGLVQSLGEAEAVRGFDFNSIINSSATFAQFNLDNQISEDSASASSCAIDIFTFYKYYTISLLNYDIT